MKLVTYTEPIRGARLGITVNDQVYDLEDTGASLGLHLPNEMVGFLQLGQDGIQTALEVEAHVKQAGRPGWSMERVKLLAPILRPPKILALAGNYAEHVRESGWQMPDKEKVTPRVFVKPVTAVNHPGEPIIIPNLTEAMDYELEMAAVIGTTGRFIDAAKALDHVAGYMVFNDVSARSLTIAEGRTPRERDAFFDWLNGKWFDTFAPMGPYLVTSNEVGDPQALDMQLKVNDEVRQDSTTAAMVFTVAELVAFISQFMTLEPGDVIATGTPSGVGMGRGVFLEPGDVIEAHIEKLGTLVNPVDVLE
jgi:2-keto-4-pentenoate hydratase/2-oxohepta-3-ene-1,7-dioic acid hydratase in catechol pathway